MSSLLTLSGNAERSEEIWAERSAKNAALRGCQLSAHSSDFRGDYEEHALKVVDQTSAQNESLSSDLC